jgi:hypothetical protein
MPITDYKQVSLIYICCVTAFIIFMGLFYQEAWQYPVVDSFPLIEKLMEPNYLPNDFYTNTFNDFSPRLISAKCISFISETTSIHYTYIIAYGNILRIWLYAIALYLLFKQLTNHNIALIAFSFASLSFLSVPFLPAWWPVTFDFTSNNIALTLSMFAWLMVLKDRISYALLLLSLSVLIHPLVGVHSLLLSLIMYISYHGLEKFTGLFKKPVLYIFGTLFVVTFFSLYLSFEKVLDDQRFIEINGLYRHAHHFIFSHMDIQKWLSTLSMLMISIWLLNKSDIKDNVKRLSIAIFSYASLLTLVAYLFVEISPTRFMISFIPMRAFPILVPLILLVWASFAYKQFIEKNYLGFYSLFLPFLPYHKVGLTWFLFPDNHELTLPLIMILVSMLLVYISRIKLKSIHFSNSLITKFIDKVPDNIKPATLILPIALSALLLSFLKLEIKIPQIENEAAIYQWIKENTSENDIVLSELDAANNQKIRLLSKRSVVISKDFPFNEKYFEEWYLRYKSIYVDRDNARGNIDKLSAIRISELMDMFSVDILIRTQPIEHHEAFTLIGKSEGEKGISYIYRHKLLGAL